MNQDFKNKSREIYDSMVNRLVAAARSSQNSADMFEESLGKFYGSNRTDGRCIDIIQRFERLTAGELAEQTGLTTGAVTTIIDRLEKAGVARRIRDKKDRRKVFIELTDFSKKMIEIVYTPMGEVFGRAMADVSVEDIGVICEYLEFTDRLNRAYASILEKHSSKTRPGKKILLERAENFAHEAKGINSDLAQSWGAAPSEPPRTGKGPLPGPQKETKPS